MSQESDTKGATEENTTSDLQIDNNTKVRPPKYRFVTSTAWISGISVPFPHIIDLLATSKICMY